MRQSLRYVLWSSCHADSIRDWDAAWARFRDSAVRRCSALQFATGDSCKKLASVHGFGVLGRPEVLRLH